MGIRRGSLSFTRFHVSGKLPKNLRSRFLEAVRLRTFVPLDIATDATEGSGWCALERPFDLELDEAKLFYDRFVLLGFRVDKWRIPGALIRAQLEEEEAAILAKLGRPRLLRGERAELKQKITLRLRKKILPTAKVFDVLWDLDGDRVLFFGHSSKLLLDFTAHFERTFDMTLEEDSPFAAAERADLTATELRAFGRVAPMSLVDGHKRLRQIRAGNAPAKAPQTSSKAAEAEETEEELAQRIETTRFLGPEFLLWIWLRASLLDESVRLGKLGQHTAWLDGTLALKSAMDPGERVTVRGAAPQTSPEAREAIRNMKYPERSKVVIEKEDRRFSFVLSAERFAIAGAELPAVLVSEGDDAFLERMHLVEELLVIVDRLFAVFLEWRLGAVWAGAFEPAVAAWAADEKLPGAILADLARADKNAGKARS